MLIEPNIQLLLALFIQQVKINNRGHQIERNGAAHMDYAAILDTFDYLSVYTLCYLMSLQTTIELTNQI